MDNPPWFTRGGTLTLKPIIRVRSDGWIIHDQKAPLLDYDALVLIEFIDGLRWERPVSHRWLTSNGWWKGCTGLYVVRAYRLV